MSAEWKVLVADDEPAARRAVRQLLAKFPEFVIVGECRNGEEVLAALDALQPDVVFLDIQMPGMDGFEVIRRRPDMPIVVFLTAYDQFAIRAFEAEALDYLLKPVSEERFATTITRIARQLGGGASARPPGLIVTTSRGMTVVPLADIDWIEAAGNYARLWIAQRSHLLRESLRELEQRVQEQGFVRAHRNALVRVSRVRALEWRDGAFVAVLASGARIPVSRRLRAAFVAAVRIES